APLGPEAPVGPAIFHSSECSLRLHSLGSFTLRMIPVKLLTQATIRLSGFRVGVGLCARVAIAATRMTASANPSTGTARVGLQSIDLSSIVLPLSVLQAGSGRSDDGQTAAEPRATRAQPPRSRAAANWKKTTSSPGTSSDPRTRSDDPSLC